MHKLIRHSWWVLGCVERLVEQLVGLEENILCLSHSQEVFFPTYGLVAMCWALELYISTTEQACIVYCKTPFARGLLL